MQLIIKNCKILKENKLINTDVTIDNGIIKKIGKTTAKKNIINANNKLLMPGMIDSHVHFREPGLEHKEDFLTGSIAAAKGGITTILDMPNTKPPTITIKDLEEKKELAKKSVVNYGFHFGAAKDNIAEIKKLGKKAVSVKVFMDVTTGNMNIKDDKALQKIFSSFRLITVHAEKHNVKKAIDLIKKTTNRLYLCHISKLEELDYIKKHKNKNIFAEATPHHLFLTEKDAKILGNFGLMKPNLASKKDQDALWKAIEDNTIDTIGTDHAPHTIEEKDDPVYGVPGVETALPLLLDAVNDKRLTLKRLHELVCENPAKIFGIKNKGYIKEGYDADLILVDLDKTDTVRHDFIFSKCGWTPFEGKILKGWPVMTIVNGNVVYDHGMIIDTKAKEIKVR